MDWPVVLRPSAPPQEALRRRYLRGLPVVLGDQPLEFVVDVLHLFAGEPSLIDACDAEDELETFPRSARPSEPVRPATRARAKTRRICGSEAGRVSPRVRSRMKASRSSRADSGARSRSRSTSRGLPWLRRPASRGGRRRAGRRAASRSLRAGVPGRGAPARGRRRACRQLRVGGTQPRQSGVRASIRSKLALWATKTRPSRRSSSCSARSARVGASATSASHPVDRGRLFGDRARRADERSEPADLVAIRVQQHERKRDDFVPFRVGPSRFAVEDCVARGGGNVASATELARCGIWNSSHGASVDARSDRQAEHADAV